MCIFVRNNTVHMKEVVSYPKNDNSSKVIKNIKGIAPREIFKLCFFQLNLCPKATDLHLKYFRK
jgi:hypothetical protein